MHPTAYNRGRLRHRYRGRVSSPGVTNPKEWAGTFDRATRPYQFALQARAGTDALAAHVRAALALRPDTVLLLLDGRTRLHALAAFLTKLHEVPSCCRLSVFFMAGPPPTAGQARRRLRARGPSGPRLVRPEAARCLALWHRVQVRRNSSHRRLQGPLPPGIAERNVER